MATLYNCGGAIEFTQVPADEDIEQINIWMNCYKPMKLLSQVAALQLIKTDSSDTETLQFEDIARNYLGVQYGNFGTRTDGSMVQFFYNKDGSTVADETIWVAYNYEKNIKTEIPSYALLNDYICTVVDPRMYLFICFYDINTGIIAGAIAGAIEEEEVIWSESFDSKNYYQYTQFRLADVSEKAFTTKFKIYTYIVCSTLQYSSALINDYDCSHKFALYYINKKGGLDSMLLGKCIESWSAEKETAEVRYNGTDTLEQTRFNISQTITKKISANTLLLTEEQAAKIDNLIFSPAVYIHDLEADEIYSALITTSSVTKKYSRYDHAVYYSFDVEYSNKSIRL